MNVFRNPGSLLGTILPFVEGHALLADAVTQQLQGVRVPADGHDDPEYVCVCRLADACGMDLE